MFTFLVLLVFSVYVVTTLNAIKRDQAELRQELQRIGGFEASRGDLGGTVQDQEESDESRDEELDEPLEEAANEHTVDVAARASHETDYAVSEPETDEHPVSSDLPLNDKSTETVSGPWLSAKKASKHGNLLEDIGSRWSVWVGGIAMAIGAIFLLRYSINSGFFGPGMRVFLASSLGVTSLGLGEWLRRNEVKQLSEIENSAYIPGVLTAVGFLALMGSAYVSYALYDFIGASTAFVLLAFISLGALGAGLKQGPAISALGLLAAFVTPLLVSSNEPAFGILYVYLLTVAVSAFVLGRQRNWDWLSIFAIAGAMLWAVLGIMLHLGDYFVHWAVYLTLLFCLIMFIENGERFGLSEPGNPFLYKFTLPVGGYSIISLLALTAYAFSVSRMRLPFSGNAFFENAAKLGIDKATELSATFVFQSQFFAIIWVLVGLLVAWRWSKLYHIAPIAGLSALLSYLLQAADYWNYVVESGHARLQNWTFVKDTEFERVWDVHLMFGTTLAICLFAFSLFIIFRRLATSSISAIAWAVTGTVFPLLMFIVNWLCRYAGEVQVNTSLALAGFSCFALIATELLFQRGAYKPSKYGNWRYELLQPASWYAGVSVLAFGIALKAVFGGAAYAIAISLLVSVVAVVYQRRRYWVFRSLSVFLGGYLAIYLLFTLRFNSPAISEMPILNDLLIYFGIPAMAFGFSAWLISRNSDDFWSQAMEALCLSFTALLAVFEVRHYMNSGELFAAKLSLDELSLQILVGLSFSFGLSRVRSVGSSGLLSAASNLSMIFTLIMFVLGNLILFNPLVQNDAIIAGGTVLNSLFLGYLTPSLLLASIVWFRKERLPELLLRVMVFVSATGLTTYLTCATRLAYQSPDQFALVQSSVWPMEIYTLTVVLFCFGGLVYWLSNAINELAKGTYGSFELDVKTSGLLVLVLAGISFSVGNLFAYNPMLQRAVLVDGGFVFNSLMLAYLIPAIVVGLTAFLFRQARFESNTILIEVFGAAALISLFVYVTTMVRLAYNDKTSMAYLSSYHTSNLEQYTYSAAWLLLGIMLFLVGLGFNSRSFRLGSMFVIVVTVLKVFLIDMSALEGLLRALSFVGLGAVLMGMGFVYQRYLVPTKKFEKQSIT